MTKCAKQLRHECKCRPLEKYISTASTKVIVDIKLYRAFAHRFTRILSNIITNNNNNDLLQNFHKMALRL